MYRRILLAYDGSTQGRCALREGALLAKRCGAQVFLLSVVAENAGSRMADSVSGGPAVLLHEDYKAVFQDGVARLRVMGFEPVGKLVTGEPAKEIAAFAAEIDADLVVVGHRRQSLLGRWWSGPNGAYLVDHIRCSLLVGRNVVADEAFEAELREISEPVG